MKKLLLVAALAVSSFGFSQSNNEGTIHINLLGGFTFGGNVTDKSDAEGSEDVKSKFASGVYGLGVHYGLSENMSIGIGFTTGSYILTPKELSSENDSFGFTQTMSMKNFNVQGRYYVVNNDDFNFYGGLNLGFATATDKFGGFDVTFDESFKASGLSYGLNTGINYYWGNVGGIIQLGYDGAALSGDVTFDGESEKIKRSVGGISFMAGLAIKIN